MGIVEFRYVNQARLMGDALCDLWRQRWREIEQGLKKIEEDVSHLVMPCQFAY